jgi:probable selenium-dependent hydroxylase accessory protein YqeC
MPTDPANRPPPFLPERAEAWLACHEISAIPGLARPGNSIALVGGGGKTTIMYQLTRELLAKKLRVIATTSTKIWPPDRDGPLVVRVNDYLPDYAALFRTINQALAEFSAIVLVDHYDAVSAKLIGIHPWLGPRLRQECQLDTIICEADGSRQKGFKFPADHEPQLLPDTTHMLVVMGGDCLDQPLIDDFVQRSARLRQICSIPPNQLQLSPAVVATALRHREGFFERFRTIGQKILFVNRVASPYVWASWPQIRTELQTYDGIDGYIVGQVWPRVELFYREYQALPANPTE